jgi:hypothetical protein
MVTPAYLLQGEDRVVPADYSWKGTWYSQPHILWNLWVHSRDPWVVYIHNRGLKSCSLRCMVFFLGKLQWCLQGNFFDVLMLWNRPQQMSKTVDSLSGVWYCSFLQVGIEEIWRAWAHFIFRSHSAKLLTSKECFQAAEWVTPFRNQNCWPK